MQPDSFYYRLIKTVAILCWCFFWKAVVLSFETNYENHVYCFHVHHWNGAGCIKQSSKMSSNRNNFDMNLFVYLYVFAYLI